MNESDAQKTLIGLWLEKAEEAMASAKLELNADHVNFAVNRLYYACFYAVTALLLRDGKQFARHSAIRSEFNRTYIINRTGLMSDGISSIKNCLTIDRRVITSLQLLLRHRTFQHAFNRLVSS